MAAAGTEGKDRGMSQTPPHEGADTANLRDYSRLRRSRTDRKVAGVAGGLGRHLDIDPTILRVAFVVLVFFGGAGLLLYAALWLFVPEEGREDAVVTTSPGTRNTLLLVVAVVAGLLVVGDSVGGVGFPWPLALVVLVIALFLMNRDRSMSSPITDPGSTYAGAVPPATAAHPVGHPPPPPRPDRGPRLFWFTLALVSVAVGSLGLYDVAGGRVPDAAYPALALTVVGLMLVVGAWFGRAGGLILLGLVATVGLVATSAAEPDWDGERRLVEAPTTALMVQDRYHVPAGRILLDLSNIRDVARLDGRSIDISANAGEILVVLPEGVDVAVEADISFAGEVTVLEERRGGTGVSLRRDVDGGPGAPSMDLEVDLVVGEIRVRQS